MRLRIHDPSGTVRLLAYGTSLFVILTCVKSSYADRILIPFLMPFAPRSHHIAIESIVRGLSERGHHITLLLSNSSVKQEGIHAFDLPANKTIIYNTPRPNEDYVVKHQRRAKNAQMKTTSPFILIKELRNLAINSANVCDYFFQQTKVLNELISSKYDVVLCHVFMPCEVLLASHLQVTSVFVTSSLRLPSFHEDIVGMPLPTAYVPSLLSSFTDEMTFFQRLRNLIFRIIHNLMTRFIFYQPFSHVQKKHNISIDKTVAEMHSHAALWLSHIDITLDWPRPVSPNWIPIGGITAGPAEPLPLDLEEFVQGSGDDGIIIFTLGAAAHALYNEELAEKFASVFGRLPQRILWRQDGSQPKNLANNTKLVKWLPQNDLLGHPKTRLLIYHGGSNGVHEAVYHAVPMVIIPFLNDQFPLGAAIQGKGIGLVLHKNEITEKRLESTINAVLINPRFQKRMNHLSAIHHDSPETPRDRAVFWIEHILKFGGEHLRPRSADMSFIELYMVDVAVFLTFCCALTLYAAYWVLKNFLVCSNCIKDRGKKKKD